MFFLTSLNEPIAFLNAKGVRNKNPKTIPITEANKGIWGEVSKIAFFCKIGVTPQRKLASKNSKTPLWEKSVLKGAKIPCFISAAFKRYAPKTTNKIPTNFIGVGISWRINMAMKVVKTGVKDAMGEISEMGDLLIAQKELVKATESNNAAIPIYR